MVLTKDWLPRSLAAMLVMFTNVLAKIDPYEAILPITHAQTVRIKLICNEFIAVYNYVTQCRATTESLVEWRDNIFYGSPTGDDAKEPPAFPSYTEVSDSFIGIITEFRELRELIVASPGYTRAIGEDLMIVAVEGEKLTESEVAPSLKVTTDSGYEVHIVGKMQGMDAIRIEYQRSLTADWHQVAFFTRLPGRLTITPQTPGQPENGNIRAIFIEKNEPFGDYSPSYPVTIS